MGNVITEWDEDADDWVPVLSENEDEAMKEALAISNSVQEIQGKNVAADSQPKRRITGTVTPIA